MNDTIQNAIRLLDALSDRAVTLGPTVFLPNLRTGNVSDHLPIEPRFDRRTMNNPMKNLKIGVRLTYQWQKRHGRTAEEARNYVYGAIVKTAIKKEVECDGSTAETPKYVTCKDDLPTSVLATIDQGFAEYSKIKSDRKRAARASQ